MATPNFMDDYSATMNAPSPTPTNPSAPDFMSDYSAAVNPPTMTPGSLPDGAAPPENAFLAGVQGFNSAVERLPANIATGIAHLGGQDTANAVSQFYQNRQQQYQADEAGHPIAAAIGGAIGSAAAAAPVITAAPFAGIAAGGLAAPAIAGALGSAPGASPTAIGVNALLGAGGGVLGNVASGALKWATSSPTDIMSTAIQNTLDKFGGDFSKVTPESFLNNTKSAIASAANTKNQLYKAVDNIAAQEGVSVPRTSLSSYVDSVNPSNLPYTTPDQAAVYNFGKGLIGDGNPVDFKTSSEILSQIKGAANTAFRQGNSNLARMYGGLQDAMTSDIATSGGSPELQAAKNAADSYFATTYKPLSDIDMQSMMDDHFADSSYTANAMKSIASSPKVYQALGPDLQNQFAAAHINALANASIDPLTGMMNPSKYGNALSASLRSNPEAFGDLLPKIQGLASALDVSKALQSAAGGVSDHTLGQRLFMNSMAQGVGGAVGGAVGGTTGAIVGEPTALALSFLVPKAKYLYNAGKALANPSVSALLSRGSQVDEAGNSPLASVLYGKALKSMAGRAVANVLPSQLIGN